MSQYAHLSTPDPELAPLLAARQPSSPLTDVPTIRKALAAMAPMMKAKMSAELPPESTYTTEDHTVNVDGGTICVRSVSPVPVGDENQTFPVLVWFHGGGYIVGDLDMDDYKLRRLAVDTRIVIVNVDYRLAPEHPFPTPHNDCHAAVKWTILNASKLRGDLDKGLLLAGGSAGANLATVVAHRAARDPFFMEQGLKIRGQLLQVPGVIHPDAYPEEYVAELLSLEQNKDAPALDKEKLYFIYECIGGQPTDPEISPLLDDHAGVAPAYIQVCGLDPLRDEGILFARVLRESGVDVKLEIYPGVPHGFHYHFNQIALAKKWEEDCRAGVHWLLGRG